MDHKREIVLDMGVEGGGATIFRVWSGEGRWVYHLTYCSIALDKDDNDEWRCGDSGPAMNSLPEALSSITGVPTWIICYPVLVHPEYRSMVWEEVKKAQAGLSDDQRKHCQRTLEHTLPRWEELCQEKASQFGEKSPGKPHRPGHGDQIDLDELEEASLDAAWERLDKERQGPVPEQVSLKQQALDALRRQRPGHGDDEMDCDFFRKKCSQQLHRTQLACKLAMERADQLGEKFFSSSELANQCVDRGDGLASRVPSLINKTHFLLLKVNFEYFLNRIVHWTWEQDFSKLILLPQMQEVRESAERHATEAQTKNFVLGKIRRSQGLRKLGDWFHKATGFSLEKILAVGTPPYWDQIHIAFEVRHLIEHGNGKIDDNFLKHVTEPCWKKSSWKDQPRRVKEKIEIRTDDFRGTFQAMVAATDIVANAVKKLF